MTKAVKGKPLKGKKKKSDAKAPRPQKRGDGIRESSSYYEGVIDTWRAHSQRPEISIPTPVRPSSAQTISHPKDTGQLENVRRHEMDKLESAFDDFRRTFSRSPSGAGHVSLSLPTVPTFAMPGNNPSQAQAQGQHHQQPQQQQQHHSHSLLYTGVQDGQNTSVRGENGYAPSPQEVERERERELLVLKGENLNLKQTLRAYELEVRVLKKNIEKKREEATGYLDVEDDLRERVREAHKEVVSLTDTVATLEQKLKDREKGIDEARDRIAALEQQLLKKSEEATKLAEQNARLKLGISEVERHLRRGQEGERQLMAECYARKAEVSRLRDSEVNAKREAEQLRGDRDAALRRVDALLGEVEAVKEKLDAHVNKSKASEKQVDENRDRLHYLEEELVKQHRENTDQAQHIIRLKQRERELQDQLESERHQSRMIADRMQILERETVKWRDEALSMREHNASRTDETMVVSRLQQELDRSLQESSLAKAELAKSRTRDLDHEMEILSLQQKLAQVQAGTTMSPYNTSMTTQTPSGSHPPPAAHPHPHGASSPYPPPAGHPQGPPRPLFPQSSFAPHPTPTPAATATIDSQPTPPPASAPPPQNAYHPPIHASSPAQPHASSAHAADYPPNSFRGQQRPSSMTPSAELRHPSSQGQPSFRQPPPMPGPPDPAAPQYPPFTRAPLSHSTQSLHSFAASHAQQSAEPSRSSASAPTLHARPSQAAPHSPPRTRPDMIARKSHNGREGHTQEESYSAHAGSRPMSVSWSDGYRRYHDSPYSGRPGPPQHPHPHSQQWSRQDYESEVIQSVDVRSSSGPIDARQSDVDSSLLSELQAVSKMEVESRPPWK
eukprot:Rmarinus@m.4508